MTFDSYDDMRFSVSLQDGYGSITEALARGLNIELGVAVTEIDYGSGR